MAWSNRPWILEGAAVRVSMIGFDNGNETERVLDDKKVVTINADLTGAVDLTQAKKLAENLKICFIGTKKAGQFDIDPKFAHSLLNSSINPNGRPNSDVVFPWLNGQMIVRRAPERWIIYFGEMSLEEASLYKKPFEYVRQNIYPDRQKNNEKRAREKWWQHRRPATEMREAVSNFTRYVVTPRISKHRIFAWCPSITIADDGIYIFARDDDYFFGVLHSKLHELWALRQGTSLEDRPRYTPTTTFETFPFPWPGGDPRVQAIAQAARDLVQKRDAWLNPPGASPGDLKKRTLTNLYNQRPTWLDLAHRHLDQAVLAAYGWPPDLSDDQILERLLALNLQRAQIEQGGRGAGGQG
jgi:type II restriction/modification system DNA methylase subunit YeeA